MEGAGLTQVVWKDRVKRMGVVHPPPFSASWAENTLTSERPRESGDLQSMWKNGKMAVKCRVMQ